MQAFEASQVLYVLALAASKISVLALIDRIFSGLEYKHELVLSRSLMVIIAIWGIGSALAVSVDCDADQILPHIGAAMCPGAVSLCPSLPRYIDLTSTQTSRWLAITIFDSITEFCLVALPTWCLTDLQMDLNNKITAGTAFGFRLA